MLCSVPAATMRAILGALSSQAEECRHAESDRKPVAPSFPETCRGGSGSRADLPHLALTDPTAAALHYTEDAKTAATNPTYKAGSECANCQFFQGKAGDEYGPCQLFAGKSVHSKGWCASWSKKA